MNPGSGLSGFERGRYFDAPKDAGGNVIQPTALNEIKLDGQHPYVAVDLWEQYSLDRLREKESFIREALILLNAAKSHPKITPEDYRHYCETSGKRKRNRHNKKIFTSKKINRPSNLRETYNNRGWCTSNCENAY